MSKDLKTFLVMLIISIFPIIMGIALLRLHDVINSPKWESLGLPPETPVRFISGYVGDAGYLTHDAEGHEIYEGRETKVYVETVAGSIYECCARGSLVWEQIEKNQVREVNWADSCLKDGQDQNKKHIEGEIDNYAIYWCGETDVGRAYYSLRKDGTIWIWKEDNRWIDGGILFCKYSIFGAFLVVAVAIILEIHRKMTQK